MLDIIDQRSERTSLFVRNRVREIIKRKDINFPYGSRTQLTSQLEVKHTEELKESILLRYASNWLKENANQCPTWNVKEINEETIKNVTR